MTKPEFFTSDSVSIDSEIIETIIGLNTKFKGSVKTDKIIRIDGEFEGDITSTAKVIISETGKFNGEIRNKEDRPMIEKLSRLGMLRIMQKHPSAPCVPVGSHPLQEEGK